MGTTILKPTEAQVQAEQINFTILINNCARELKNAHCYWGVPQYDQALAHYLAGTGHELHLKLDFPALDSEVYAPLKYRSETLNHSYYFPVIERNLQTDEVFIIDIFRFMELVVEETKARYHDVDASNIYERLQNSLENLAYYLNHFNETGAEINAPKMSFIEAEQKLVVGHYFHPLTKSRQGFSASDREEYSPETAGRFALHYFLVHPECVEEKTTVGQAFSQKFREEIETADEKVSVLLKQYPDWKVVPVHPWEANYLLQQEVVKEMLSEGVLHSLGILGKKYTPTSSLRTIYCEESEWMLKCSLHVKITSAERVNHKHELERGYDYSRFLKTPLGQELQDDHPAIVFMEDPGFITVHFKGKNIDGFNLSIRRNPFYKEQAEKNVSLLVSLCQGEVMGQQARLKNMIQASAMLQGKTEEKVAKEWFKKYLKLILPSTVKMFEKYGVVCELHQQNLLVEFDDLYLPTKLYIRDNQSYLFREVLKEKTKDLQLPEDAYVRDKYLHDLLSHFLIVSNVLGVINVMGENKLSTERELLELFYEEVESLHKEYKDTFTAYLLKDRFWCIKANLLTALRNIDGGRAVFSVVFLKSPNMLHKHFFSDQLIHPQGKEVFFSRYFPKEDVTINFRPIDLQKDLEMLHEWFHRDHAVKIWKMNWSLRELEVYYRTMIPEDVFHSYIGEANGVPACNIEIYWATRDMVGDYYDVMPTDYGTHQFIAPTDPKKKYVSPFTQCMVDYVFAQSQVGKMVGEGATDSLASMMNKAHVGFKVEKVIEMPHKQANLNFCYREWYWEKFPQNKDIKITPEAQVLTTNS